MTNYKRATPDYVISGGNGWVIYEPKNSRTLYYDVGQQNILKSLRNLKNATLYQVPSGKKFRAMGMTNLLAGVTGTNNLYEASTEDATTTLKRTWLLPGIGTWEIPLGKLVFTQNKYLTIDINDTNTNYFFLYGYEETA